MLNSEQLSLEYWLGKGPKRRNSHLSGLRVGNAMQIIDFNSCLKDICDSHTRYYLYFNCHYDKCDQGENTYPGMIL